MVAGLWNVLPSKAVELAINRRPEFVIEDEYLKIGRVTLPRLNEVRLWLIFMILWLTFALALSYSYPSDLSGNEGEPRRGWAYFAPHI